MLKSPFDIAVVFAIMALVVVTIGFGIESVEDQGANVNNKSSFFSNVEANVYSSTGLKGTSDEASDVIDPSDNPVTVEATEEGIITQGLQSLRSVGSTYNSIKSSMSEGTAILGVDPIYYTVVTFTLVIILFVIIYTWARGR